MKALRNHEFNPGIIFCNYFVQGMSQKKGKKLDERYIYDYELELITESDNGLMVQNGILIKVNKGDIIFRRPGERTQGIMCYNSYIFCFELQMGTRFFDEEYDLMKPKSYQIAMGHSLIDNLPSIYHSHHYDYFLGKFKEMIDCYLDPEPITQNYLSALVIQMLYQINHEIKSTVGTKHKKSKEIVEALDYIEAHIGEDLTLEKLSQQVHLSPIYFHQVFGKIVGLSPHQYIISKRINLAKEQLIHSMMSIKEIAYMVGYKDTSYFCQAFKKDTGYTPLSYREKHQFNID